MKMKILLLNDKKSLQCGHMVDQDMMKGPSPIDDSRKPPTSTPDKESKFARVKRMLTCNNRPPSTYDEARASCKARKRKERQESISSIFQERKVIRSNSEERPIPNGTDIAAKQDNIRRVSSHEDFQKTNNGTVANIQEKTTESSLIIEENGTNNKKVSPCRDISADIFIYDECEFEKRRSHERFSKATTHRTKYSAQGRRPRTKHFQKPCKDKHDASGRDRDSFRKISPRRYQENAENKKEQHESEEKQPSCDFLQLQLEEKERSPSPVHSPISPPLDLSTLHEQIDCSEPIPSSSNRLIGENTETLPSLSVASNRLLSSPRNSVIITQRIYLSSEVPQNNTSMGKEEVNPQEERLKHLSKHISSIKKKIKKYDEEFESRFGYRPSHADKLNDKTMKKLCADLNKLKKEHKQLKEDSTTVYYKKTEDKTENERMKKSECTLQDTLIEIENRLNSKRATSERSEVLDEMTNEQLVEEKIAVQKSLLYLESMHGRPTNKDDRDLVRPIYDRYRQLKRLVRLTTPSNNINELATIHEHETMDFVSLPTQAQETDTEKQNPTSGSTDSDTDTSIGENLHSLSLEELQQQQRQTSEEKKELRRSLKQFEDDFQTKTGKKLQKEDRAPMEHVYVQYKKAKAKLRLLDALVGKQAL